MSRFCIPAWILAILFLGASPTPGADPLEAAKEQRALLQCQTLAVACEAYMLNPANPTGQYPTILPELVKPPFGGASYLKNGEKDLIDPWGNMVRYAVAKDEKGNRKPYVWTERTVDGKTKVIGTKPPEPKKSP